MTQVIGPELHTRKTSLRLVQGCLDEQSARRGRSSSEAGHYRRRMQEEIRRYGSLQSFLSKTGTAGIVDAPTVHRALGTSFFLGAVRAEARPHTSVDVITSLNQSPTEAAITCLDITAMGGGSVAVEWVQRHAAELRGRGKLLIAGIGREGGDLSTLAGFIDGFVKRPRLLSSEAWRERIAPVVKSLRTPESVDTLSLAELQGGISEEEFAETLAQAALPDTSPLKRD